MSNFILSMQEFYAQWNYLIDTIGLIVFLIITVIPLFYENEILNAAIITVAFMIAIFFLPHLINMLGPGLFKQFCSVARSILIFAMGICVLLIFKDYFFTYLARCFS